MGNKQGAKGKGTGVVRDQGKGNGNIKGSENGEWKIFGFWAK